MSSASRRFAPPRMWWAVAVVLISLVAVAVATSVASAGGRKDPADTVLLNGKIWTADKKGTTVSAVAIDKGKFVYVGSNSQARRYIGSDTEVIDLKGKAAMPGLSDGHVHELSGGRTLIACSLEFKDLDAAGMRQVVQACLDETSDQEPDGWLDVDSWLAQAIPNPDKSILDALNTTRPIIVRDTHVALVNSRALELAGITAATPDPPDGRIARFPNGEPNGILVDGAIGLVGNLVPPPTFEEDLESLHTAVRALNSEGITSIMDASANENSLQLFKSLRERGDLTLRVDLALRINQDEATADSDAAIARVTGLRDTYADGKVTPKPGINANIVKLGLDGLKTFPAQTGALIDPYLENIGTEAEPDWVAGDDYGELYFPNTLLNPLLRKLDAAGWQIHMHVVGDRATKVALDGLQYTAKKNGLGDHRHTLVHIDLALPSDYPRFKKLRAFASMSYQWAKRDRFTIDGEENYMGPERFRRMYPAGSLVRHGAKLGWGSDWPVDPLDEWFSLEIGVTRTNDTTTDPKYTGVFHARQRLTLEQVLRSATNGTSYQLHREKVLGSIEVGKFADLIVLSQNPFKVAPGKLSGTRVKLTFVGGEVVFDASTPQGKEIRELVDSQRAGSLDGHAGGRGEEGHGH